MFGVSRLRLIQKLVLMVPLHFLAILVAISALTLAKWNFCYVTALTHENYENHVQPLRAAVGRFL